MATKFSHTNIIARDWKRLSQFYADVFGCVQVGPTRDLAGDWLDLASGVPNAHLSGVHLRLPGYSSDGPTLEIFSYDLMEETSAPGANRVGFGHIAFAVDDVDAALDSVVKHGGSRLGIPVTMEVAGAGSIRWVYARDPEGNILELQKWH